VKAIALTSNNQAAVKISVAEPYAPLHDGTEAVIRLTSLSGIANRYVALSPGPGTNAALGDDATLDTSKTTTAVDLDQLFNSLDPKARKDLQGLIKGFSTQYEGKAQEAADSTKYFNPLLSSARRLVNDATADEGDLTRFLVSSSRTVTTVAEKRDDLSALVGNANATTGAIASENRALSEALALLPTTLRRANTTFVNLRATLDDLDPLVAESKPATKDLAPFLRELRPLVQSAIPTIHDLRRLVTTPGANNDLIDATRKMPALQRVASPTFKNSTQALVKSQPVLEYIRPYTPELTGWFHDFGQGTANYDANGHFARIQPIFNAFQFTNTPAGGTLVPNTMNGRFNDLEKYQNARCPGAASQPTADGSAPNTDDGNLGADDCDPSQVPPGP
jgi:phospholipid/cholesterol/gamma-HCH transport system substrate-binding protein